MEPISRRALFAGAAAITVAACSDDGSDTTDSTAPGTTTGTTDTEPPVTTEPAPTTTALPEVDLPGDPFTLGVASGDPDATSVVLWTRLAPDPQNGGGMPDDDVAVLWEISATDDFAEVIASGTEVAVSGFGHTVHAVVTLEPGDWWYRFRVGDYTSPVGLTRAAPSADQPLASVRFAAASCQNYAAGWYAAHRDISEQQPDFVVFLGDYMYEGAEGPDDGLGRTHLGPEPTTLVEYRNRYALYKSDANLRAAHEACPWFVIWDDHEVENNYANITPQDPADAAGFEARRSAAYQAWWEHQPVRLAPPATASAEYRIYRDFQWGDLVELALLDGRQYRSDQACGDATLNLDPPCPEALEDDRTMLGDEQATWLLDTLDASTAAWNVIGNQTVLANAMFNGAILNYDQWDGYPAERTRLMQAIADLAVGNLVVVTGDIHLAAVGYLRAGGDAGIGDAIGVEFITTSVSSDGLIDNQLEDVLKTFPDLVDAELAHRGYALHTVTPERWVSEYRIVDNVADPDSVVTTFGTYTIESGSQSVTKSP